MTDEELPEDVKRARDRRAAQESAKKKLRERLGRVVRAEWVLWAKEQPDPKPHWLHPWEQLAESDREVDRRIGERIFSDAMKEIATRAFGDPDAHERAIADALRLEAEERVRTETARRCAELCQDQADGHDRFSDYSASAEALAHIIRAEFGIEDPK